jgi:hypothetical protein
MFAMSADMLRPLFHPSPPRDDPPSCDSAFENAEPRAEPGRSYFDCRLIEPA